MSGNSKCWL